MCTVTLIARQNGYFLGMNRDEKRAREMGLPPRKRIANGQMILSPSEPEGGTWISLTDAGATFALINWYSVATRIHRNVMSRGMVVEHVAAFPSADAVDVGLPGIPLAQINPFRLIGIFPASREIAEWRWDTRSLVRLDCPWESRQWISSGLDEPAAQRIRGRAFDTAQRQSSAGGVGWMRRLHRSHHPQCGPFSTCMHRVDAETVSYTEISVSKQTASMRYVDGAPCRRKPAFSLSIKRR